MKRPDEIVVDRLMAGGVAAVAPIVGRQAAVYSAESALAFLAAWIWAVVLVVSFVATSLRHSSVAAIVAAAAAALMVGCMILTVVLNKKAGVAASEHLAPSLGFRPRWPLGGYWGARGWQMAIERQKRWHEQGRWPVIPL